MTMRVLEFPIQVSLPAVCEISIPRGAEILHVAEQHGQPCIWALVDPDEPLVVRRFLVAGTGDQIDDDADEFVGSFLMPGGDLVFHVFELTG